MRLHCCFVGCDKDADVIIIDKNEQRYDVAETHSCIEHVGEMIGSVEPTNPIGPWELFLIKN